MSNQICDTIFVMDTEFNVIGMLSNNGAFPNAPFFDDVYISELATGAETYEFSTYSNPIISEILELGNYIVFKYGDIYKLFQIMDNDDEHKTGQVITCYCEMAGLELLTDYCEPFSIEGNVELFFNTVLQDTNWSLGGYSSSLATNIQQVKVDKYTNVYKVIQENISTYGYIEIEYRVEFNGNTVTGFFIDVYENGYRGDKTYKRFEYGENVEGIKRNRNMYDFASAMIGTGKDGLTFKDVEWRKADGKPADKPKGQDFIVDLGANERFNKRGKYIKSLFDDGDITNPQDLLLKSWEKLQEVKEPKFDYEVDLALTDGEFEDISIGDTVYVIDNDYNPPILLECRVGKLETSLTDSSKNKCTLSNYKEVASKIREPKDGENGKTPEIGPNDNWWVGGFDTGKPTQGPQGLPGKDGEPAKYVRVAGEQVFKYTSGFAGTPTPSVITIASSVIGVTNPSRVWSYKTPSMSNYVNMSSTDANIVIMHNDVIWGGNKSITVRCSVGDKYDEITLVKVSDGVNGTDGLNGADGINGKDGVSLIYKGEFAAHPSSPQDGWYYRNTTDKKCYVYQKAWYQMTIDGKDGLNGNNGKDGLSIEYKGIMANPPSNPQKNWTYKDSDNGIVYIYTGIAWEVLTYDGDNGQDGADGQNGLSIFVTYNDSVTQPAIPTGNGTTNGWHTNSTVSSVWISQKVASSATTGTWGTPIKIKGESGIQGNGVKSTQEEFYLSSDKVNRPSETDPGWTSKCPQWQAGKYIWTRIKMTYTNNNVEYVGYSVDTSWEVVNDLQIGTRNLLQNTDFKKLPPTHEVMNGISYKLVSDDRLQISTTDSYVEGNCIKFRLTRDIQPNETLTISFKGNPWSSINTKVRFKMSYGAWTNWETIGTAGVDVYYSKTFNVGAITANTWLWVEFGYGCTILPKTLKITNSNKDSDWSPAIEDIDNAIGNNVANVDVMFYLSTSNISLAGGEWKTTAPPWEDGKYMWQKTVTTLGNGQTTETQPTCIAGAKGDSGYTIVLSNENHAFPCQFNGNIPNAITTKTKVIALKGTKEITPTIGTLPTIPGLTLTKSGATITVVANVGTGLADYGSFDIPITVDGIGFTKTFTWSKSKAGANGTNGTNGSNGISPLNATLSGQSLMKYLDKTTAPTPATIAIKCKAMKGATEVTGACSYQWQAYYSDKWNNIGTGSSMNIAYNSSYFLNLDILQIRVNVTYGNETITLEHTISKVYDNKYITQQEIFNKLTENGNDFLYTDPNTGKIYINITYAKAGQLVADLIKGGILTLGGTGDNTISDYGVLRILDFEGVNELARIDGGEAWFQSLSATEMNVEKLSVNNIEASGITQQVTSTISISINSSTGNDESEFIDEAIFATLQGALDACPRNLGGRTVNITLETDTQEDIYWECYYSGRIRIYWNGKTIYGYMRGYMNSNVMQFFGGTLSDSSSKTGKIMPNKGYNHAGMSASVSLAGCGNCFMQGIDIYSATNLADGCKEDAALCCGDGGYIYIRDVTPINCTYGFRANANAVVYSDSTGGKASKYGFTALSGGQVRLSNGKHTGGSSGNTYESSGGEVKYHNATFEGTSTSGSNTSKPNPTTYKATYTSNYGDTYRSGKYYSWKKDNTVRQGDYGYGDCNGVWFFSTKFAELKGRTITKVTIKISRTTGGTSSSVTHTLKAHKNSSRPGGMPSYIDGYSQTFGLAVGSSTTVTITNSTVLNAIKNGECKGFGLQSAYDKSHYSVCKGSATVTIYYQ